LTGRPSIEQIVDGYWRNYQLAAGGRQQRLDADEWFWAWIEVDNEVRYPTPRTFALLLSLVDSAKDDQALAYVGAGPIEDLINWHGADFLDQIEEAAGRDHAFRTALSGVRVSPEVPKPVRDRLATCVEDLS
jgi:hypothetical protein